MTIGETLYGQEKHLKVVSNLEYNIGQVVNTCHGTGRIVGINDKESFNYFILIDREVSLYNEKELTPKESIVCSDERDKLRKDLEFLVAKMVIEKQYLNSPRFPKNITNKILAMINDNAEIIF